MRAWDDRGFEFDALGRAYVISREVPANALELARAASLVRDRARQDRSFRSALADWARGHGHVWTLGDELQIVDELVRLIAGGMVRVHERGGQRRAAPPPPAAYPHAVMPEPLAPLITDEIVDDPRALQITHCPPLFDPREAPLRISYLLRDLHGHPVELRIRSEGVSEPMHRRMLSPNETADGPGVLEWDGKLDDSAALVGFEQAPLVVELVYDATYRSEAVTTLPPELARLHVAVPDFLRFDNNSALLLPAPWTDNRHPLAAIVRAYLALLDHPELWLAVVGHASAAGNASSNQALSEHRAEAVRALVHDDEAAWVQLAREHGSLRDVVAYLDYLATRRGWSCAFEGELDAQAADPTPTSATKQTRSAVSAFQSDYNARFDAQLDVDGVCGKRTLAAVFRVLYQELERWLAKLGGSVAELPLDRVVYLGHGTALAPRQGSGEQAEAADRVLDLLLVEGKDFDAAIAAADLYAITQRQPFEIPDDDWATGPFTIVSDLTPDEPAERETYVLRSEDGSWAVERVLPDEGEVESGELVLRFDALPTEHRYGLVVISHGGNRSRIFENVPYGELYRAGQESS